MNFKHINTTTRKEVRSLRIPKFKSSLRRWYPHVLLSKIFKTVTSEAHTDPSLATGFFDKGPLTLKSNVSKNCKTTKQKLEHL
jgi:hypothetical protein